jgi:glycosyltransferase involved in cell wall biosynthesis
MRLSHVVPSIDPRFGGPSVSVPNLAMALAHAGHEVSLFATAAAGSIKPPMPGVAYRHAPIGGYATLANSPELLRLLRHTPADLIHAHALWQRPLHYAHQCAAQAGVPLVISPRGMMTVDARTNTIIIRDVANNHLQLSGLIAQLDVMKVPVRVCVSSSSFEKTAMRISC